MMSRYKPVGWKNDNYRHYLAAKYGVAKVRSASSHATYMREMAKLQKEVEADIKQSPKVKYSEPTIKHETGVKFKVVDEPDESIKFKLVDEPDEYVTVKLPDLPAAPTKKDWEEKLEYLKTEGIPPAPELPPAEIKHIGKNEFGFTSFVAGAEPQVVANYDVPYTGPVMPEIPKLTGKAGEAQRALAQNLKETRQEAKEKIERAEAAAKPFVEPYVEAAKAETADVKTPQEVKAGWFHRASVAVRGVIPEKLANWEVKSLQNKLRTLDAKEIALTNQLKEELRKQQVAGNVAVAYKGPSDLYKRKIIEMENEKARLRADLNRQYALINKATEVEQ